MELLTVAGRPPQSASDKNTKLSTDDVRSESVNLGPRKSLLSSS